MRRIAVLLTLLCSDTTYAQVHLNYSTLFAFDPSTVADLGDDFLHYMVPVRLGTPPSLSYLAPAVGNSATKVIVRNSCVGPEKPPVCQWGSYNITESSTLNKDGFNSGDLAFNDVLQIGNIELAAGDLTIFYDSPSITVTQPGALGLGRGTSDQAPRSVPEAMTEKELITSPAYSIWADSNDGTSGHILFGAADSSKFSGELSRLAQPPFNDRNSNIFLRTNLISFRPSVNAEPQILKQNDGFPNVAIDPFEPFSWLPNAIVEPIQSYLGGTVNTSLQGRSRIMVPCATARQSSARLSIRLGGNPGVVEIQLAGADLIIPESVWYEPGYSAEAGREVPWCLLGLQNWDRKSSTEWKQQAYPRLDTNLGASVLRNMYMVFDTVNKEVSFAPLKLSGDMEPDESTTVSFESHGSKAPLSVAAPELGSSDTSDSGSSGSSGSKRTPSIGATAGIAVGSALGTALLIAAIIFFLRKRKKVNYDAVADAELPGDQPSESPGTYGAVAATEKKGGNIGWWRRGKRNLGMPPGTKLSTVTEEKTVSTPTPAPAELEMVLALSAEGRLHDYPGASPVELGSPGVPSPVELETPDVVVRPVELETPGVARPAELDTSPVIKRKPVSQSLMPQPVMERPPVQGGPMEEIKPSAETVEVVKPPAETVEEVETAVEIVKKATVVKETEPAEVEKPKKAPSPFDPQAWRKRIYR